jgi:hypothetical protein
MPLEGVREHVVNTVGKHRIGAFEGMEGYADSVMFKRDSFEHEAEVRLVFVDYQKQHEGQDHVLVPFDPWTLFEEVVFEPRLAEAERREREASAAALGLDVATVRRSELYYGEAWIIGLDDPDDPPDREIAR